MDNNEEKNNINEEMLYSWYVNPFNKKRIAVLAEKGDFFYYYEETDDVTKLYLNKIGRNKLNLFQKTTFLKQDDLDFFLFDFSKKSMLYDSKKIQKILFKLKIKSLT